jgi:hypothetical protein
MFIRTPTTGLFARYAIAAVLIGTMAFAGSVWAKGSQSRAALGTSRIDVQLLSVGAPALPTMTIDQLF